MNKKFSLYIHIPFCFSKCGYCDFISYSDKDEYIPIYFDALIKEIEYFSGECDRKIDSVYVGGGTPSYVAATYIKRVIEKIEESFVLSEDCEISMEANPGTIDKEKATIYKDLPINRFSLGVQTLNDSLLKVLGRTHTTKDIYNSIELFKDMGVLNFNVDLMYALPGQSIEDWATTVRKIIELSPTHISAYALSIEEGTEFYKLYKNKEFDDELDRKMYVYIIDELKKNNFERYEISNFAIKGYECKHNLYCWGLEEYRGFGAGAHSFVDNKRFNNYENIGEYISMINTGQSAIFKSKIQSESELISDYCILALRTSSGINLEEYNLIFKHDFYDRFGRIVSDFLVDGLMSADRENIALSDKGFDYANVVMREFL